MQQGRHFQIAFSSTNQQYSAPVGSLLHSVITNSDFNMIGGEVAWIGAVRVLGEFLLKLLFE